MKNIRTAGEDFIYWIIHQRSELHQGGGELLNETKTDKKVLKDSISTGSILFQFLLI